MNKYILPFLLILLISEHSVACVKILSKSSAEIKGVPISFDPDVIIKALGKPIKHEVDLTYGRYDGLDYQDIWFSLESYSFLTEVRVKRYRLTSGIGVGSKKKDVLKHYGCANQTKDSFWSYTFVEDNYKYDLIFDIVDNVVEKYVLRVSKNRD